MKRDERQTTRGTHIYGPKRGKRDIMLKKKKKKVKTLKRDLVRRYLIVSKKKKKNQAQSLEVLPLFLVNVFGNVPLFLVNINLLSPCWCKSTLAAQMISNVYSYSMENKILW